MPALKSFIGNEKYHIGCTGQTVFVYDKNGEELAHFKDLTYAYNAKISPAGDIFVVRSTTGRIAVYSLEKLTLIKKFRFSKVDYSQDDNFCFSKDGKELYNIERHTNSCKSALSVYDTKDFSLKKRLFLEEYNLNPSIIEYDTDTDTFLILCAVRGKSGSFNEFFIAKLINDELCEKVYISAKDYNDYILFKHYKDCGYTNKKENLPEKNFSKVFLSDIDFDSLNLRKLTERYL